MDFLIGSWFFAFGVVFMGSKTLWSFASSMVCDGVLSGSLCCEV